MHKEFTDLTRICVYACVYRVFTLFGSAGRWDETLNGQGEKSGTNYFHSAKLFCKRFSNDVIRLFDTETTVKDVLNGRRHGTDRRRTLAVSKRTYPVYARTFLYVTCSGPCWIPGWWRRVG